MAMKASACEGKAMVKNCGIQKYSYEIEVRMVNLARRLLQE